jgi:UDP-N-acetylglucosamine 3-dehydrogenase
MARTTAQGEKMAKAAACAGRTLGIGYSTRYHEAYRIAREYMMSGKLGRVGTIRTSRCADSNVRWHADIEANGGAIFEILTHDLDWLQWSLGPVKRIFARGAAKERKTAEKDYCLAVVRFAAGTIAHLEGSLAETDGFYASYEIAGTGGLLAYDTRKAAVLETRIAGPGGLKIAFDAPSMERPFARQIGAFVAAVREGREYEVDGEEALPALRLAEAAFESLQTGKPVSL